MKHPAAAAGLGTALSWIGRFAGLSFAVILLSCSDGPSGPGAGRPAELTITPRYVGAAERPAIDRVRLRAEERGSGRVLGSLDRSITQGSETAPIALSLDLEGRALEVQASVELLSGERVEWSGQATLALAPGDQQAKTLDLFRGPLANLSITQLSIRRPAVAVTEGDTLRLSADVLGASGTPQLFWSSQDTSVLVIGEAGMLQARRAGSSRITVVAGPRSDTATVTVGQRVTRITLTPDSLRFTSLGEERVLVAHALDASSAVVEQAALVWSVADTAVVELLGEGRFRARASGSTTLTVRSEQDPAVSASAALVVEQRVAAVTVNPATATLSTLGQTLQLNAVAVDANQHPVAGRDVVWISSDAAVAEIGEDGTATAVGNGAATLSATVDGITGSAALTVRQEPARVLVTPAALTFVSLNASEQLSARALDAADQEVPGATFTWTSSDTTVVHVSAAGLVSAAGNGSAQILVRSGEAEAHVEVTVAQHTASVTVSPKTATLTALGNTVSLSAVARDPLGGVVPGATYGWTSLAPQVATVSASGVVTAVGAGTAHVVVSSAERADTAVITVAQLATGFVIAAGDGQSAPAGSVVAVAPAVRLTDANGHAIAGLSVAFAVAGGGGSLTGATAATDAAGIATLGSWTLGTSLGTNTLTATAAATGLPAVTFTATAVAGAAAALELAAGDGGSAVVGSTRVLQARVVDAHGNPVAGHLVEWATASGGSMSAPSSPTDADGVASIEWTLGTTAGVQSATASAAGLSGSPVGYSVTSTAAAAAQLALATAPSPVAQVGVPLAQQPVVQLQDAHGNAVAQPGAVVSVTANFGAGGELDGTTSLATDATGQAAFTGLTFVSPAGTYRLDFAAAGLTGVGSADIAVTRGPGRTLAGIAGDGGTQTVGTTRTLQVRVTDAGGNPVPSHTVSWSVAPNNGSLSSGSTTGASVTSHTGGDGIASVQWTVDTQAGPQAAAAAAVDAGANPLDGSPVGFSATAVAGAASQLTLSTEPSAAAQSGVAFAQQPVLQLRDQYGNPVAQSGVSVTAAIASGGGTLGGTAAVDTDAGGQASYTDLAISGTVGDRTLGFSASGLTGATSANVGITAGAAAALAFNVQPSNVVASAPITPAVRVSVVDAYGNLVTTAADNVSLALGNNPGGGTLNGATTAAASGGVATFSNLSVNQVGAGYTLIASSGSLAGATSAGFDVTHGPLDHFLVEAAGGGPIGDQSAGIQFNVRVTARDANDNTVTSFTGTVGFTSTPGGGISAGATSGAFTAGVLGSHAITFGTPGSFTLTATHSSGSESGTSNSFAVTAPPTAVPDGPAANSAPGEPYHAFFSTSGSPQTFILPAPGVLSNDDLGFPAAAITSFGADSLGGNVVTYAVGTTVSPLPGTGRTTGSLTVNADGSISFTPPDGFTGNYVFRYRLTNSGGTSDARVTIAVGERPVANSITYPHTLVGNVPINTTTSSNFSVSSNDQGDGTTLTLGTQTGGTVLLGQDGTFAFRPSRGHSGAASFTYTVRNGFGTTAPATVSLVVGAPIWFVRADAPFAGDGRFDTPYNSLPTFAGVNNGGAGNPANDHSIFLYSGGYTGGLTLRAGQRLIGQGASASLSSIAGVSWPADAGPEPAMGGAAPTITAAAPSTNGLNLGGSNTLRGFNLGNATGTALRGTGVGSLTIGEVSINTNGRALELANGTVAGGFTSVTSTGGANNVVLGNLGSTGTFDLGSGSLSGAGGDAFRVDGGNGSFSYAGSITNTSSLAVYVTNRTGGTLTFSGNLNPDAPGRGIAATINSNATINFTGASQRFSTGTSEAVSLVNNSGSTFNFTGGGLEIATTFGNGFEAGGGGTVSVTGANNTLSSAGGHPLYVANTTIGVGGLNFRSISANGGTNGIVLSNTGSSGGLTVTGTGTAGTGGTIQNIAGDGVRLSNTRQIAFNNLSIQNTGGSGVKGAQVVGFSFTNGVIHNSGTGWGWDASNIAFNDMSAGTQNNLSGTVTITGNTLTNAYFHGVDIFNRSGTLSDVTIADNTITSSTNADVSLGSGIRLVGSGSAGAVASITRATLHNNVITNFPSGSGLQVQGGNTNATGPVGTYGTPGSGTEVIAITDNQISGQSAANRIGVEGLIALVNGRGQGNFTISGNSISHTTGISLSHSAFGQANVTSTISGNTIVANNSFATQGIGVRTGDSGGFATNTPTLTTTIANNQISQVDGNGILAVARGNATGTLNARIQSNTVAAPLGGVRPGIRVDAGDASGNNSVCLSIWGNTSAGSGGHEGIGLRKQGTAPATNAFGVHGMAATSSPDVEDHIDALNPNGNGTLLISATSGFSSCSLP